MGKIRINEGLYKVATGLHTASGNISPKLETLRCQMENAEAGCVWGFTMLETFMQAHT